MYTKPVTKSIKKKNNNKKKSLKSLNKYDDIVTVTVITCTNRPLNMKNVFNNYKNVNIYQIEENISLEACLNFSVKKFKGTHISKVKKF